jgi:flagellar hook-length control protein FliK
MRLRLDPPNLGVVDISVSMGGRNVRLTILPSNTPAAELLNGQLHQLRESIESHGLAVTQLSVQGPRESGTTSQASDNRNSDQSPGQGERDEGDSQDHRDQQGRGQSDRDGHGRRGRGGLNLVG